MTPVFLLRHIYSGKRIPQNEGLFYVVWFALYRYIIYAYAYIIYLIRSFCKSVILTSTMTASFQMVRCSTKNSLQTGSEKIDRSWMPKALLYTLR